MTSRVTCQTVRAKWRDEEDEEDRGSRASGAPLLVGGPRRSELVRVVQHPDPWRALLGDARSITRSFDGRNDPRRRTRCLTSKKKKTLISIRFFANGETV